MNSKDIRALLYKRYPHPQYAFFEEVSNGTGFHHTNYCDAVVCGLWPSAGLEIEGFEIKSKRGDWLNEMKRPSKSSAVYVYCHRWWLVAEKGVAKLDEIPVSWGFLELVNGRFYKRKTAPLLKSKMMTREFIASLLRRATEDVTPNMAVRELNMDAYKRGGESKQNDIDRAQKDLEQYKEKVSEFEKASGISILDNYMEGKEIAAAVSFVLNGGFRSIEWDVESSIRQVKEILGHLSHLNNVVKEQKSLSKE